jgi:16S rRNA processing protein RimM
MDATQDHLLCVANIGRPFGYQGWCHIKSFTEPPGNILNYAPWHLYRKTTYLGTLKTIKQNGTKLIALIEGVDDKKDLAPFQHAQVWIDKTCLPPLKKRQFFWHQLQGCQVINQHNHTTLGTVDYLIEAPMHDTLVITPTQPNCPAILIPFVIDTIILAVDLEKKTITVKWDTTQHASSNSN